MFNKALVALDLTASEQPILDCLPALKQWGLSHIVLSHFIQSGYVQGAALANRQAYIDWLEQCAEPLRAHGMTVEVCAEADVNIANAILKQADAIKADLLVIGSRGQNIIKKMFLGSTARKVIQQSRIPLLLEWVEPTAEQTRKCCEAVCTNSLKHIVLATDFSTAAKNAELAALHLASQAGKVECLYVQDKDTDNSKTDAAMADLLQGFVTAGKTADSVLLNGRASQAIADYAAQKNASLIIVGRQGRGFLSNRLIGTTATRLCEIAGRPVLLLP